MIGAIPILALAVLAGVRSDAPLLQQVAARLAQTKSQEAAGVHNYTVLRHYVLTTDGHSAEMMVRLTYTCPGRKKFETVWERGSNFIQRRVFHKLLEAEEDAARQDVRVTPENYDLRLEGVEDRDGRRCYVIRLTPRVHKKYLVRGRAWVDAADFAVVRVEGEPEETGSFWIRSTRMVQEYRKVGRFWLPAVNSSDSLVRIFGPAHLTIESLDYQVNQNNDGGSTADARPRRPQIE
jgi:hypothetical protein